MCIQADFYYFCVVNKFSGLFVCESITQQKKLKQTHIVYNFFFMKRKEKIKYRTGLDSIIFNPARFIDCHMHAMQFDNCSGGSKGAQQAPPPPLKLDQLCSFNLIFIRMLKIRLKLHERALKQP